MHTPIIEDVGVGINDHIKKSLTRPKEPREEDYTVWTCHVVKVRIDDAPDDAKDVGHNVADDVGRCSVGYFLEHLHGSS